MKILQRRDRHFSVDATAAHLGLDWHCVFDGLTLWVMFQGYRIVTGQSREAAMGLVVTALRAALIIGLATSMAEGSS
ncbi:hypothetical protein GGR75_004371, partial [Xanthomonas campestris]|nr:hypothetical protein [Xanthomonas campestris]